MKVLLEVMKECAIFLGVAFAPLWLYILFCLGRGIVDDVKKLYRRIRKRCHGRSC